MDMDGDRFHTNQKFLGQKFSSSSTSSSDDKSKKCIKIKKRRACPRALNRQVQDEVKMKKASGNSRLLTDFTTIRTIGKGGFGRVIEVINKIDNNNYALKLIVLKLMENQKKTVKEAELLSRLHHDNIVRYYGAWIDKIDEAVLTDNDGTEEGDTPFSFIDTNGNSISAGPELSQDGQMRVLCIQMEFCETTLADAINSHLWKEHSRAWRMFWEIVKGLAYLHQNDVIHRDLKPQNIFLDAKGRIKIGDFGLATKMFRGSPIDERESESLSGEIGTSYYRAPELDSSGCRARYGQEVDIYSLGIILFEMFSPPFNTGHERHDVLTKLRNQEICVPKEFMDDENNVQPICLLRSLLEHDTSLRPTSDELLHLHKTNQLTDNNELFQMNIKREKNNPLQPTNAFYNKIPNMQSKHAFGHSI